MEAEKPTPLDALEYVEESYEPNDISTSNKLRSAPDSTVLKGFEEGDIVVPEDYEDQIGKEIYFTANLAGISVAAGIGSCLFGMKSYRSLKEGEVGNFFVEGFGAATLAMQTSIGIWGGKTRYRKARDTVDEMDELYETKRKNIIDGTLRAAGDKLESQQNNIKSLLEDDNQSIDNQQEDAKSD